MNFSKLLIMLPIYSMVMTACVVEVQEDKEDSGYYASKGTDTSYRDNYYILPSPWNAKVGSCDHYSDPYHDVETLLCYEDDENEWHTNCESGECQALSVNVHYMLSEDLGDGQKVIVEAFDNPHFSGSPKSSLIMTNFDASRPGKHQDEVLFLKPGEYYFRAYIDHQENPALPYQYQGMEVITDRPLGVFGALSDLTKVVVETGSYQRAQQPVNIYLDQLLKRPGFEEPTNARIRFKLDISEGFDVPLDRKVMIQLFDGEDFAYNPIHRFEIPSENFLVVGRLGQYEFITPDLPEGRYFIQVFLDPSENGYWDSEEPGAIYYRYGEKGIVVVKENRTETISLNLEVAEES